MTRWASAHLGFTARASVGYLSVAAEYATPMFQLAAGASF